MLALQHRTSPGALQRKTDRSLSLNGGGTARVGVQSSVPHRCPCGGGCPSCNGSLQRRALALTSSDSAHAMAEPAAAAAGPMSDGKERSEPRQSSRPTRLEGNGPGDVYEQEAGRIADRVMTRPDDRAVGDAPPRIQPFSMPPIGPTPHRLAGVNQRLAGPGRPLEPALRRDMERRFGQDLSRVRVHSDTAASQSARAFGTRVYAVGRDIVFGANQYSPATREGRYT